MNKAGAMRTALGCWPATRALAMAALLAASGIARGEGHSEGHSAAHWSYGGHSGPQNWASLDPAYLPCGIGRLQSPVDIRTAQARPAGLDPIRFDYQPVASKVIDNGHTLQLKYDPGSSITLGTRRYELKQLHFHMPSEELVDGRSFPMVAHLVHRDHDGWIAVVAVLLVEGAANPLLEAVLEQAPPEKNVERTALFKRVNASALIPARTPYYTLAGSLTTPPCSEGVRWLVMQEPVQVSRDQLARFASLYRGNARPPQPLNGRSVLSGG